MIHEYQDFLFFPRIGIFLLY